MGDWQKEYESDPFVRRRHIAQEEQERILAENAKRYEKAEKKTGLREMEDKDFIDEVLGSSYADISRGK